jgi:hypothetical protein
MLNSWIDWGSRLEQVEFGAVRALQTFPLFLSNSILRRRSCLVSLTFQMDNEMTGYFFFRDVVVHLLIMGTLLSIRIIKQICI